MRCGILLAQLVRHERKFYLFIFFPGIQVKLELVTWGESEPRSVMYLLAHPRIALFHVASFHHCLLFSDGRRGVLKELQRFGSLL